MKDWCKQQVLLVTYAIVWTVIVVIDAVMDNQSDWELDR